MAKVEAGYSDLRRAYQSHVKVGGDSMSHYLLLFYSVECGLKALIVSPQYNRKPRSLKSEEDEKILTHKINDLISHLKFPASLGTCPTIVLNSGSTIGHDKVHEAWRYGVRLDTTSETAVLKWLSNLTETINSKLI